MPGRNEPARTAGAPSGEPFAPARWLRSLAAPLLLVVFVTVVFVWTAGRRLENEMARLSMPLFTVALAAGIFFARKSALDLLDRLLAPISTSSRMYLGVLTSVVLVALLLIARVAMEGFRNSGDEYADLLQAETWARGKL